MGISGNANSGSDAEVLASLAKAGESISAEVAKIIVGQTDVVSQILTAFFARGHVVIEGVPGLAKTLMINCLADTMSLDFTRDRKSTRLNSSHVVISYAVFCLKKKTPTPTPPPPPPSMPH